MFIEVLSFGYNLKPHVWSRRRDTTVQIFCADRLRMCEIIIVLEKFSRGHGGGVAASTANSDFYDWASDDCRCTVSCSILSVGHIYSRGRGEYLLAKK